MKNEILKILSVYPGNMFQDNFFEGDVLYLIGERQETIEQLTALMCYQIVKAYYLAYADFHGELSWESFTAEVEGHYLEEFDGNGELLRQAIEQVKKENKYER